MYVRVYSCRARTVEVPPAAYDNRCTKVISYCYVPPAASTCTSRSAFRFISITKVNVKLNSRGMFYLYFCFCFTWKFQVSLRASDQDCMHRLPRAKRVAAAMADSSRSTFIDQTHNGKINYRGGRLQKNHSRLLQLASTSGDTCRTERVSRVCF